MHVLCHECVYYYLVKLSGVYLFKITHAVSNNSLYIFYAVLMIQGGLYQELKDGYHTGLHVYSIVIITFHILLLLECQCINHCAFENVAFAKVTSIIDCILYTIHTYRIT